MGITIVVQNALGRDDKQYSIHITRVYYREVTVDLYRPGLFHIIENIIKK